MMVTVLKELFMSRLMKFAVSLLVMAPMSLAFAQAKCGGSAPHEPQPNPPTVPSGGNDDYHRSPSDGKDDYHRPPSDGARDSGYGQGDLGLNAPSGGT